MIEVEATDDPRVVVVLDDVAVEKLATRVAELVSLPSQHGEGGRAQRLMTAADVAIRLGVSRSWVYDHAQDLGAKRLGGGPKARLRFDPLEVEQRLTSCFESRGSCTGKRQAARQETAAM